MNNRNLLLFVLLSALLLGGHALITSKFFPAKPAAAQASVQAAGQTPPAAASPAPAPAAPPPVAVPPPAAPSPAPAPAPTAAQAPAGAPLVLEGPELILTFNPTDGSLTQAVWRADGTKLLNEAVPAGKSADESQAFPGLGGARGATFDRAELLQLDGRPAARFANAAGDHLTYRLDGHVLKVDLGSAGKAALGLLPMPADPKQVTHMGRVFTLDAKAIQAVAWLDMLKDPFFSFVGAKRKVLPPANALLGTDAGITGDGSSQQAHYFAALWDLGARPAGRDAAGYHLPAEQGAAAARLYLGPKQPEFLNAFGPAFTQVQDFGFFGSVAKFLFWVLRAIHKGVGNWGWAIVIFTVILRFALWPLNTKMVVSQLRMKDLEPHQKVIQAKYEKFGGDMAKKAEMQKELMDFYKKNGHNPMGGCLPMLLQMPVFLALWSMLTNVFELRHAPFALWIHDLSAKDPFYVLPVLLGASMVAQSALAPPMGDPQQRKMMMILMPVMMVFFFAQSPAGLGLYYLMFNLIGLLQTWWVRRTYKPLPVVV
jgi:YidC/Oxa1 family membrane protein insertase